MTDKMKNYKSTEFQLRSLEVGNIAGISARENYILTLSLRYARVVNLYLETAQMATAAQKMQI